MHESNIDRSLPKPQFYPALCGELEALIAGESDWIANLANASALLFHSLDNVNWAGFYLLRENELVVGPFQGKPACIRIALGRGVCGTAAQRRESIVVRDVNQFPGHIACDSASNSEIVVPMIKDNQLLGVLDIDSPITDRFDEEDREGLERFVGVLLKDGH
ncbi:MAG TPA: GAF domain-containing protein [Steroidobacteraceae bacterium]|nr:GAF domain-containing protein [Steroidobacteraceae bacterium]